MNKDKTQQVMVQRLKQIEIITDMSMKVNDLLESINAKTDEYIELNENLAYRDRTDKKMLTAIVKLQDNVINKLKEYIYAMCEIQEIEL